MLSKDTACLHEKASSLLLLLLTLLEPSNKFAMRDAQWKIMKGYLKYVRRKVSSLENELDALQISSLIFQDKDLDSAMHTLSIHSPVVEEKPSVS